MPRFRRRQWRDGELVHGRPGGGGVLGGGGNGRGGRGPFIGAGVHHNGQEISRLKEGGRAITRSNSRGFFVRRRKKVSVLTAGPHRSARRGGGYVPFRKEFPGWALGRFFCWAESFPWGPFPFPIYFLFSFFCFSFVILQNNFKLILNSFLTFVKSFPLLVAHQGMFESHKSQRFLVKCT
jgi:hypothetical protein